MTPEQFRQIEDYASIIPTIPEPKIRRRHRMKIALFKEQDGLCCLCHKPMILRHGGAKGIMKTLTATFEHKELRCDGGPNTKENMPLSHNVCNNRRGTKDFGEFQQLIAANGGTPPKSHTFNTQPSKVSLLKMAAIDGDIVAAEAVVQAVLIKRLNLDLYIMAVEHGWRKNPIIDKLKQKLDKPILFNEAMFK